LRKYQISLLRVKGRESFICRVCGDSDASALHLQCLVMSRTQCCR
jgi:hypothetical protein